MDFLKCSTTDKSREGVRMVLTKPGKAGVAGQPLTHEEVKGGEQKEQYLVLLGPESEHTSRALRQAQRRLEGQDKSKDQSDEEIAAQTAADARMLSKLVVGGEVFGNITDDPKAEGKWHKVDKDLAYMMFKSVMPFRAQAFAFVLDAGNFTEG